MWLGSTSFSALDVCLNNNAVTTNVLDKPDDFEIVSFPLRYENAQVSSLFVISNTWLCRVGLQILLPLHISVLIWILVLYLIFQSVSVGLVWVCKMVVYMSIPIYWSNNGYPLEKKLSILSIRCHSWTCIWPVVQICWLSLTNLSQKKLLISSNAFRYA